MRFYKVREIKYSFSSYRISLVLFYCQSFLLFTIQHQRSPTQLVESATVCAVTASTVYTTFGTHFVGSHLGILVATVQLLHFGVVIEENFPSRTEVATAIIISYGCMYGTVVLVGNNCNQRNIHSG